MHLHTVQLWLFQARVWSGSLAPPAIDEDQSNSRQYQQNHNDQCWYSVFLVSISPGTIPCRKEGLIASHVKKWKAAGRSCCLGHHFLGWCRTGDCAVQDGRRNILNSLCCICTRALTCLSCGDYTMYHIPTALCRDRCVPWAIESKIQLIGINSRLWEDHNNCSPADYWKCESKSQSACWRRKVLTSHSGVIHCCSESSYVVVIGVILDYGLHVHVCSTLFCTPTPLRSSRGWVKF